MTEALKLFVAADPPPAAVEDLQRVVESLAVAKAGVRVAPPQRWHVTVVFLGEVPADRAPAAAAALDGTVAAEAVRRLGPITVRIAGGGTFGRGRSTILWARLAGDVAAMRVVSAEARRRLKKARLPFDDRAFRPHLTLSRPGDRLPAATIAEDVALLDAYSGPEWPIHEMHLIASEFRNTPTGVQPHYTRLHTVTLPGA